MSLKMSKKGKRRVQQGWKKVRKTTGGGVLQYHYNRLLNGSGRRLTHGLVQIDVREKDKS